MIINPFKLILIFNKNQISIFRKMSKTKVGKTRLFILQKEIYNNVHDKNK